MRGILFTPENIAKTVQKLKTQTRRLNCKYRVGEILFLKEPYYLDAIFDNLSAKEAIDSQLTNSEASELKAYYEPIAGTTGRKRNALFMPEKYARHFIRITAIRKEPLGNITEADCMKEGVAYKHEYIELYDSIHYEGAFRENPTVFVIDYELIEDQEVANETN